MNRQQLKEKLAERYSPENWKEILQYIFPNVALFQIPKDIPITNDKVESFRQLGNVRLNDGKSLSIFDVQLNQETDIKRNRVELRNLTAKYIDQTTTHGVLAVFTSDLDDYRFTFTAKDTEFDENMELVTTQTEAKRYTYVLGPNESCKTPAERFFKLHETKDSVHLENIIDAFSVEKLNKEFFNKYKEIYEEFVQFLTGKRFKKVSGKWKEVEIHEPHKYLNTVFEDDSKLARDYVKKLLGRMVFLQFLQKKGWMGCSIQNSNWEDGDLVFCRNLFESADQEQFHSNYLSKLFDALNTPDRENDIFEITNSRVPYLNGGLFEADIHLIRQMDFPASHFKSLLNFFGEYNFTIDENDPNDHEVGIDPEMLGHIFENLLEDNKDKGAFYTPKPIVQYMCQESLIQYLKTHLVNETTEIENFIRTFDKGDENDPNNYIFQNAKKIEDLLDNVKICDPAIGSGAFPMGLLQIIFKAKMTLDWTLDPAEVKRSIIQNSIYGVDIDKGAVDIARLRFWLSLVVDEKVPQPLPNLDYKIMQGNSLLESFEGVDLKFENQRFQNTKYEPEVDIFGNPVESQVSITDYLTTSEGAAQFDIEILENEYFDTHDIEKKTKLKAELDQFERSFISDCLNQKYNELETQIAHIEKKITGITIKIKEKKLTNLNKEKDRVSESRIQLENMTSDDKPYFLWHLYFMDVFKNGGFDIVIGNPPYKVIDKNEKNIFSNYETFKSLELYSYFFEVSIKNLLKQEGCISFITASLFVKGMKFISLRDFLTKNLNLTEFYIAGDKVFENVQMPTSILIGKKADNVKKWSFNQFIPNYSLISKIEKKSKSLDEIANILRGFEIGKNKVLLNSDLEFITGSDVQKWGIKNIRYISKDTFKAYKKNKKYFSGSRILIRETGSELTSLYLDSILYSNRSLYSIKIIDSEFSYFYVLGLLNSKLFQFYYQTRFKSETDIFPKIRIAQVKLLPIKELSKQQQLNIINVVKQILIAKNENLDSDIDSLQLDLNKIVYETYCLNRDEIEIVEKCS
jgi:hypothetical protein